MLMFIVSVFLHTNYFGSLLIKLNHLLECISYEYIMKNLTHIVVLHTFIVLLSYLMLVIHIRVPVFHFVEGKINIDLTLKSRLCFKVKLADINKLTVYYAAATTLYLTECGILNQPMS